MLSKKGINFSPVNLNIPSNAFSNLGSKLIIPSVKAPNKPTFPN